MTDVFLSYKAEDRPRLAPLVEALEADGLAVWWDAHIGGGDQWRETIQRHLESARCVIVAWSKASTGPHGQFVCDEAARAQRRGVYLPVRIDKVDPPLGFGETQALNLVGWKGDRADPRYQAVLKTARAKLGLKPQAGESHRPTPGISRRGAIAAGGTAALAAGVAGSWFFLGSSPANANSIAVLPFANLSGDPAQAYFSDGMAEELRNALSRIGGLKVVARTSSEMVRDVDVKAAARKLGVANVLTGSVRRSPSTIRVNAQLIEGENGMERWSESFDRPSGDVLQIQSGIAESVAQALSIRLGSTDRATLSLGGTRNPAAQDLLLRINPERPDDSEAGTQQALTLLNAAIALDPNYAEAHARKAFVLNFTASVFARSAAEARRGQTQALASANRAIAIAPRLAIGYSARAAIFRDQLNIGGALAEMVRADALPGNDVATLRNFAHLLTQSDRPDEAWRMTSKATSLDPLNPLSLEAQAYVLYSAGRYAEAAASARRSLDVAPERQRVRSILANALLLLNQTKAAAAEYRKLEPTDYRRLVGQAFLAARAGDHRTAMSNLRGIERRYGDAAHYQYGQIYAQLGDADKAVAELQLALEARDVGMAGIQVDPFVDPLRRDPRFAGIVQKLNFP